MKKKITILKLLLLLTVISNAQNWLITGNTGTNPAQNFIGTRDSKALIFRTHNIERMRITLNGNIGIATTSPMQKFDVHGNINIDSAIYIAKLKALYFDNYYGLHVGAEDGTVYIGDHQTATGLFASSADNGITGVAYGGFGVFGLTEEETPLMFYTAGVYGRGNSGIGVMGESNSGYGIYGSTNNTASYAGYFKGSLYASGIFIPSDEKLKQDVQNFSGAMSIIKQLHPKKYQYKQDDNYKIMNLPAGEHYGLLAEDVEKLLPGLVKDSKAQVNKVAINEANDTSSKGFNLFSKTNANKNVSNIDFKALNYTELIPILIKGMQEQETMLENQQQSIEELKKINQHQQQQISQLQSALNISSQQTDAATTATLSLVTLKQNFPNPFSANTVINYAIPYKYLSARLVVTDKNGIALKQINLDQKGKGSITIVASAFTPGTYQYALYVDEKLVDAKQMLIVK